MRFSKTAGNGKIRTEFNVSGLTARYLLVYELRLDVLVKNKAVYIMKNGYKELENVLSKDKRLVDEGGKLLKNKIQELALKTDKDLIKLLLNNKSTKTQFFVDIDGVMVFDKNKFNQVVESSEFLPDSYTQFSQNIVLADEYGTPIKQSNDVVLNFAYKDCVLEGGQTKEEQKNRQEVFVNEILAKQSIDSLLSPKVYSNAILHERERESSA